MGLCTFALSTIPSAQQCMGYTGTYMYFRVSQQRSFLPLREVQFFSMNSTARPGLYETLTEQDWTLGWRTQVWRTQKDSMILVALQMKHRLSWGIGVQSWLHRLPPGLCLSADTQHSEQCPCQTGVGNYSDVQLLACMVPSWMRPVELAVNPLYLWQGEACLEFGSLHNLAHLDKPVKWSSITKPSPRAEAAMTGFLKEGKSHTNIPYSALQCSGVAL